MLSMDENQWCVDYQILNTGGKVIRCRDREVFCNELIPPHLEGISPEFRGSISHLVTHAVSQRIDAHMEVINRHPVEIRRYYRQFDY